MGEEMRLVYSVYARDSVLINFVMLPLDMLVVKRSVCMKLMQSFSDLHNLYPFLDLFVTAHIIYIWEWFDAAYIYGILGADMACVCIFADYVSSFCGLFLSASRVPLSLFVICGMYRSDLASLLRLVACIVELVLVYYAFMLSLMCHDTLSPESWLKSSQMIIMF